MDNFIESALRLLEAYPGATVSVTYANVARKNEKKQRKALKTADDRRAKNRVKFKVYDAQSTKALVYYTYKAKELSKILTFLGPRGVASSKRHVLLAEPESKLVTLGVASVMSNVEFKEPEVAAVEEKLLVEEKKDDCKKKKGKKKGRK